MALQIGSDLVPAGGGTFYLLEDLYLKGSFSVRDNVAARDLIAISNLKVGQLVLTADDKKIWICKELVVATPENPDAVEGATWEEFLTGGSGGGGLGDDAPEDGKTYGRKDGAWVQVTGGGAGGGSLNTRTVLIHTLGSLPIDSSLEFPLQVAVSAIVLKLEVSRPVKVLAFSTPAMDESNPYEFIATSDHLVDDGTMLLPDGTKFRSRNFSIWSNMENPTTDNIYMSVESVDEDESPVVLTITYLPLELLPPAEEPVDPTDPTDPDTPEEPAPTP